MFTIRRAAALTGVPEATLRAWERRYAVVVPRRTESGYRIYSESNIDTILAMQELLQAGWAPREAARQVRAGSAAQRRGQSGRQATRGAGERLLSAAARLDAMGVEAVLDDAFARGSFESVVDGWLMPALGEVGTAWHEGRLGVAGEHLVSAAVHRRLAGAFQAASRREGAPHVLTGLASGCRHELGLLAFATALRRAGMDVTYLGVDLPTEHWLQALAARPVAAVVLTVPMSIDVEASREVALAVRAHHPATAVQVGGGQQMALADVATPLGHRVGLGAQAVARQLRA
jgi:DNA-binding transcriptional MerR regulator/methylmalonyl-CoA mutase cobalamin-binding subunit